jgi:hypothetical protein
VGGILRPSALAVLRLMINSNRVGCSTGSSVGCFQPGGSSSRPSVQKSRNCASSVHPSFPVT